MVSKHILRTCPIAVALYLLALVSTVWGQAATGTRDESISHLRGRIAKAASLAEKIELERTVAYLWLGHGCSAPINTDRFVAEAERILTEYKNVAYHYSYLDVKVSYAQLLPTEKREALLWEVINFDPREIQPPAGQNPAKYVNRLKQGAIWAYLNGAIGSAVSAKPDVRARRFQEEAEKLSERLKGTEEGKRCVPLALWWRDTVLANKPRSVPIPALAPPPHSKWDVVADDAEKPTQPATQPIIITKDTTTSPKDVRSQRTFDSVEYKGTIAVAEPDGVEGSWLPWGLGGVGAVMLAAGVILVLRRRMEEKP